MACRVAVEVIAGLMTTMFLNEDAYYRVLKAFAAGTYDLVSGLFKLWAAPFLWQHVHLMEHLMKEGFAVLQKKEMLLAKLRKELVIPDQRHEVLRAMIEDGRELKER